MRRVLARDLLYYIQKDLNPVVLSKDPEPTILKSEIKRQFIYNRATLGLDYLWDVRD